MSIEPTAAQLQRLAGAADGEPVVMLNLLRFNDLATGIDAADGISGADAYGRYAEAVAPFLAQAGGRVLLAMTPRELVIAPEGEEAWDIVLAVQYPSRAAFLTMIADPGYLEIHQHRSAALADSRLIACAQLPV
jgi:uncharacterized protein (DUF1330 family)